ncbi:hypothetical protein [Aurantimonas sp. HBX-1]|uniref:hypothetical protein n=1 Tax=Aurantimonas sp. HBX-1 TaxID=2906072 RepID=UPI001F16D276|nr:hypothetical protein [Aurantimonas sp. HBX-1]UIJ71021.1 hypothetical protein LXB15_15000 [Aurantimonas sp. HBX-1]
MSAGAGNRKPRARPAGLTRIVVGALGLLAILVAIGLAVREPVADKPYLKIAGAGFIFNYRVAEVFYGFTAEVQKPVRNMSLLEAEFEDPGGGPPIRVSERLNPRTKRYSLRTPPIRGVEKDRPYRVTVRLIQNGDNAVLFQDEFTVTSQMADAVVPEQPLTVGPGYARNPALETGEPRQ